MKPNIHYFEVSGFSVKISNSEFNLPAPPPRDCDREIHTEYSGTFHMNCHSQNT